MELPAIERGSHVCWVLPDQETYIRGALACAEGGRQAGEAVYVFGPGPTLTQPWLDGAQVRVADPYRDVLDRGALCAEAMFSMFRDRVAAARAEGHTGVRVIADMDWLLAAPPTSAEAVAFEALLGQVVLELGATVVCAYRAASFTPPSIEGVAAVHHLVVGADPMFAFVPVDQGSWRLSGEVDVSVVESFDAALRAAAGAGATSIDLGDLRFVDCAAMRAVADVLAAYPELHVWSAPPALRRLWAIAGLDAIARLPEMPGERPFEPV